MAEAAGALLHITVAASLQPGQAQEWFLRLPVGATVAEALRACLLSEQGDELVCGIWGRVVPVTEPLRDGDRVECCRPLIVDPKLARRQRFKTQGARAAGLFAKRRPGAKPGY